ncbi:MAG: hypothetical protein IKK70_02885 [Clostridia bacterium]|nr:hypothetical protein [Clostridia bacterium]
MKKSLSFVLCLILMLLTFCVIPTAENDSNTDTDYISFTKEQDAVQNRSTSGFPKRAEVEARAIAMANMQWTVKANHLQHADDVSLPSYVGAASAGNILTGIPYCWGGFHGLDENDNWMKFSDVVLLSNQTAGNVNCNTPGHRSRTIGLDCSGFVSSAYKFEEKVDSENFHNYGTEISFDELKPMDFMCASGHHIMLYHSHYVNQEGKIIVNVYDCVTKSYSNNVVGKVSFRQESFDAIDAKNYKYYTPWNPVCTYTMKFTVGYHYRECTDCGHKQPTQTHTFVFQNNRYRCSVCGYTTSNLPEINSTGNQDIN